MGQKSRWVLPEVVHPTKYRRFVVCVPEERFYIAAFQGLLIELTYSKNWQRDPTHKAADVSRVWQHALETVLCDDCGDTILFEELEYVMSVCEQLRFHNGKLQGFCCGEWVDIDGQTGLPPNGGDQPGGGTEQPPAGGCVTYHAKLNANGQWYLPTVVSSGDEINITNANGAGNDGTVSPWHCPDGSTFFAGACIGGTGGSSGGDPDTSIDHMAIIANIDGTWYEAFSGTITVPGGVSNASVYFQVNDSDLTDNAGSYVFDVEVCNNQEAAWSHDLNLALDNSGFAIRDPFSCSSGSFGVWTPGIGFEATDCVNGTTYYRGINFGRIFPADVDFTSVVFTYDLVAGTAPGSTNHSACVEALDSGGSATQLDCITAPTGTGVQHAYNTPFTARGLGVWLGVGSQDMSPGDGSGKSYRLQVSGTGYDPFV